MTRYIISIRRDRRDQVPRDWIHRLHTIKELTILETASPRLVMVEGSEEAVAEAERRVGCFCHVEREVRHKPL